MLNQLTPLQKQALAGFALGILTVIVFLVLRR